MAQSSKRPLNLLLRQPVRNCLSVWQALYHPRNSPIVYIKRGDCQVRVRVRRNHCLGKRNAEELSELDNSSSLI
jgi:hypothetical protein